MTRAEAAVACPIATAFVAKMRKVFGEQIEVVCVQENGLTFGTVPKHWKEDKHENR